MKNGFRGISIPVINLTLKYIIDLDLISSKNLSLGLHYKKSSSPKKKTPKNYVRKLGKIKDFSEVLIIGFLTENYNIIILPSLSNSVVSLLDGKMPSHR